jgi:glutamine synthetase
MVIGGIVRAGLEGIRAKLPLPHALEKDPAEHTAAERAQLGIVPLPSSLAEALDALEADPIARQWLPKNMYESYVMVKRKEIEMFSGAGPEEICKRYHDAY